MKKVLVLIGFILSGVISRAQMVTIPDAGFVTWLTTNYPSCMTGNQMDITCPAILSETSITFGNQNISNLSGIEYFTNLDSLNCSMYYGQLTTIPAFPPNLTYLVCGYNTNFVNYPPFPNSLLFLDCSNSGLSSIPALPPNLTYFSCYGNNFSSLPSLPSSLVELNCYMNQLTGLPALPATLETLSCGENPNLSSLPSLPATLLWLGANNCGLTSLPSLPAGIWAVDCSNNQLSSLPVLPNELEYLHVEHNQLVSLPSLPDSLLGLYCTSNQLLSLPVLPNLTDLLCDSNQIACFPSFPTSLNLNGWGFNISGNPFNCLPNYVSVMDAATLAVPLCVDSDPINNPNACTGSTGVNGSIYLDVNSNCAFDAGDIALQNIPMNLYDANNVLISQTYTAQNGVYQFVEGPGTYRVEMDTVALPFQALCATDSTITLDAITTLVSQVDFALTCNAGFDIGIQSVWNQGMIFPGQNHSVTVQAGDLNTWFGYSCASGLSGQVTVTINGPVTYTNPIMGSLTPSVSGNVLTYTIADFSTINWNDFSFNLLTDNTAQSGDQICIDVNVSPTSGDYQPANNDYHFCYTVVNSCDPNYKEVYPIDVPPAYEDWLTYTVHFQNIGTAPAINIHLTDTLDANIDLSTFEVISYSHANRVTLDGSVLTVRFPSIFLADSASDFQGSMGFIQYRAKPISGLSVGTQITNTAHIYFDFNAPIITNIATTNYVDLNALEEYNAEAICAYPNPTKGLINIAISDDLIGDEILIYNAMGVLVYKNAMTKNLEQIDLSLQASGVYLIQTASGKLLPQKIVKQ